MKRYTKLAVLFLALLIAAALGAGALAEYTELESQYDEYLLALSSDEVQAELLYQELMACTTLKDMLEMLESEANESIVPCLNETQLRSLYQRVQEMYGQIAEPTEEETMYYELLISDLSTLAEGYGIMLAEVPDWPYGGTIYNNYTNTVIELTENVWLTGRILITDNATLTIKLADTVTRDIVIGRYFNSTAKANTPNAGAMFFLQGNAKLIIQGNAEHDIILDGVDSVGQGIVLYETNCNVNLEHVTFRNMKTNSTTEGGAAIYVVSRTNSTLGQYNNNRIDMDHVTFVDCEDTSGNSIVYPYGKVTMTNCTIKNCKSTGGYGGVIKGSGGYHYCDLTMKNCTATGNYSSGWGGVLLWACNANGAKATLDGCTFENNEAKYLGGAISVEGKVEVKNCKIINNKAAAGGGIAVFPFTLDAGGAGAGSNACGLTLGSGNTITGNEATETQTYFTPKPVNDASTTYPSGGGGIWCYMFKPKDYKGEGWTGSLTIVDGNNISGNTSATIGGGVALMRNMGDPGSVTLTVKGGTIENNEAPQGAGIGVRGGDFYIEGGTVQKNTASSIGGGVYVEAGNLTMSGGKITENTAVNGGGAYVTSLATAKSLFKMTGGTISLNTASQNGGGAYVDGGEFIMENGTIGGDSAGNSAINGGGAYVNGGDFTMTSGTMSCNKAIEKTAGNAEAGTEGYGGGAYANGGNISIGVKDCKQSAPCDIHEDGLPTFHPVVKQNEAVFGGGLAVNNGKVFIYCCNMQDNKSDNRGTGENVFMSGEDGQIDHYWEGAEIGEDEDHGMVSIGGKLNIIHEDGQTQITIRYHSNDKNWREDNVEIVWEGKAPDNYYLNLPYCPSSWKVIPEGLDPAYTFAGWSDEAVQLDDEGKVRSKPDYNPIGTPIQLLEEKGQYDFYAVWAPVVNYISYAYTTDNENIQMWKSDADFVKDKESPAWYQFQMTTYTIPFGEPTKAGYKFTGWEMYTTIDKISNWDADAYTDRSKQITEGMTSTERDNVWNSYVVPAYDKTGKVVEKLADLRTPSQWNNGKIEQNFGDIVLVAKFVPEFSQLKIVKQGVDEIDVDQCFLFSIKGQPDDTSLSAIDITVTIKGNGDVTINDLPTGTYVVTELEGWSWRYEVSNIAETSEEIALLAALDDGAKNSKQVTVNNPNERKVLTFTNRRTEDKWLDGDCYSENVFEVVGGELVPDNSDSAN